MANGADALFIGHSFFIPVARDFDETARAHGFTDHSMSIVRRGGAGGSAQAMWENHQVRQEVLDILNLGETELFGMTMHSDADVSKEFFALWIQAALEANPDTTFFIGQPWVTDAGGLPADELEAEIQLKERQFYPIIKQLRAEFPQTDIYFISYGSVMSRLREEFDAGRLDDLEYLIAEEACVGDDPACGPQMVCVEPRLVAGRPAVCDRVGVSHIVDKSLFRDRFGHAGPMAVHVSALVWLHFLYDADIPLVASPDYDWNDTVGVAADVVRKNNRSARP